MDKPSYKLVGAPCGQHGQYTFYKAIRFTGAQERIVAIGDFFFVKIWQDSELVSIGELQLLWTDRVSDQTLVCLRLYFLPENTPDGRSQHGEDEVLAINDKVVVRAEDLVSWVWSGAGWRWGLRAVWRGACAPPPDARASAPLHHTRLDFTDVDQEKSAMAVDTDSPGVVVFSYPRYCRYRALLSRLEGVQGDWLRDSLVAALGGYAAPTTNTRILYCKDTFEYPELEGHEFVCNHLAPRLKGRPRGRRRRAPSSPSPSPSRSPSSRSRDSDSDAHVAHVRLDPQTPRRLSLRNGAEKRAASEEEEEGGARAERGRSAEDAAFMTQLRLFYARSDRAYTLRGVPHCVSLRSLYVCVWSRGGYEAVCRRRLWRALPTAVTASLLPARTRRIYEKYLLPYENHERRNGSKIYKLTNGSLHEPKAITTIDVTDSPLRDEQPIALAEKRLRTPSPSSSPVEGVGGVKGEAGGTKEEVTWKRAEDLNKEFLDSLPKDNADVKQNTSEEHTESKLDKSNIPKMFEDTALATDLAAKHRVTDSAQLIDDDTKCSDTSNMYLKELAQKLSLGNTEPPSKDTSEGAESGSSALSSLSSLGDKYAVNGHATAAPEQKARPVGRSSLRAVRVKPTRPQSTTNTSSVATSSTEGVVTNFGIHRPPQPPPAPPAPCVPTVPSAQCVPAATVAPSAQCVPAATVAPSAQCVPAATVAPSAQCVPAAASRPPPTANDDDDIVEVPYKPKTPEIIDLDEYPESPVKKKKLDILKERGLEVTAVPPVWPPFLNPMAPFITPNLIMLNPVRQPITPPKVIQGTSIFGTSGPEKTVYGNPKDPFMPPPHILHGTPVKPQKVHPPSTPPQDILDLTCKTEPGPKPAVEIVRVPSAPSPSKTTAQNLTKNYTLLDGKAVVGSNLEITLVNPKTQATPTKRPSQKRSSNGKFMAKTPTPPKDYPKPYQSPKKNTIVVPNFQSNTRDDVSPTSSTGSKDSTSNVLNAFKNPNLAQLIEMQKNSVPNINQFIDPMYMSAFYNSLGQMDQRQLAMYRDFMANQFRGYSLLNIGTPTTKN